MQQLRSSHGGSAFGAATRLAQHCAIGRFVAEHSELGLRIVRHSAERTTWQALDDRRALRLPRDFEPDAERQAQLFQHQQALLDDAAKQGQLTWRERKGFRDFAFLLSHEQDERLFLVGLECATAPLSYKTLEQAFALCVGGSSAQAQSSLFADFVAVALSRPVVTPALLRDLQGFCELLRDFVQQAPQPDSVPPPASETRSAGRLYAGVVAVAIAPSDAARAGRDPLRALVEARRLLHEMQSFAAEHDSAVALPLEDYGALLTLPARSGVKAPPKPEAARKLAEKLRQLALTRLQLTTVAGTALAQHAPESREAVGQRAILALRMALENGQAVLLLDDLGAASKAVRHSHVLQALDRLCSTFERQAMSEAGAMAHAFIQAVTCFAGGRLDLVRLQYVLAITQVAKATQRRHCLAADMPETWGDEAALKLDACRSLEELTSELKRTLNRLALLTTNHDGPSYLRIDELLDYLRHNLAEPVKLPQLARRTGFSVPSFCRVFKRATGHSLLSYVRGLRIDRAKHLLATTELPNNSVAELSGFHSQHHFIRSFKKVMRSTPGEYRRALLAATLLTVACASEVQDDPFEDDSAISGGSHGGAVGSTSKLPTSGTTFTTPTAGTTSTAGKANGGNTGIGGANTAGANTNSGGTNNHAGSSGNSAGNGGNASSGTTNGGSLNQPTQCDEATAVVLGSMSSNISVASNACLKMTLPADQTWIKKVTLQPDGGTYPLAFTWSNCGTNSNGAFSANYANAIITPVVPTCPIFVKLTGSGTPLNIQWWGG